MTFNSLLVFLLTDPFPLCSLFLGGDVNENGTPTKCSDQPKPPESGNSAETIKSVSVSSDSSSLESEEPCTSYAYAQEGPQKKVTEAFLTKHIVGVLCTLHFDYQWDTRVLTNT